MSQVSEVLYLENSPREAPLGTSVSPQLQVRGGPWGPWSQPWKSWLLLDRLLQASCPHELQGVTWHWLLPVHSQGTAPGGHCLVPYGWPAAECSDAACPQSLGARPGSVLGGLASCLVTSGAACFMPACCIQREGSPGDHPPSPGRRSHAFCPETQLPGPLSSGSDLGRTHPKEDTSRPVCLGEEEVPEQAPWPKASGPCTWCPAPHPRAWAQPPGSSQQSCRQTGVGAANVYS